MPRIAAENLQHRATLAIVHLSRAFISRFAINASLISKRAAESKFLEVGTESSRNARQRSEGQ
jgi:hypothetical protein